MKERRRPPGEMRTWLLALPLVCLILQSSASPGHPDGIPSLNGRHSAGNPAEAGNPASNPANPASNPANPASGGNPAPGPTPRGRGVFPHRGDELLHRRAVRLGSTHVPAAGRAGVPGVTAAGFAPVSEPRVPEYVQAPPWEPPESAPPRLVKWVEYLQRVTESCDLPRVCFPEHHWAGLGSQVHVLSASFMYHLARGEVLLFHHVSNPYVAAARCETRPYSCLFQPVVNPCGQACGEVATDMYTGMPKDPAPPEFPLGKSKRCGGFDAAQLWEQAGVEGEPAVLKQDTGTLQLGVIAHLLRPVEEVQRMLPELYREVGLLGDDGTVMPYIGLHVRHGDKKDEGAKIPLEKYMAAVKKIAPKVGTRHVFLSSDDLEVQKAREAFDYNDFELHVMPEHYFSNRTWQAASRGYSVAKTLRADAGAAVTGGKEGSDEGLSLLAMVQVMANAQGFVGGLNSNIDRLVYGYALTRGDVPTYDVAANRARAMSPVYFPCTYMHKWPWGPKGAPLHRLP